MTNPSSGATQIKTVGVVGSGTMGAGIAQLSAQSGYDVVLYDLKTDFLDRAKKHVEKNLARLVEKGKLAEAEKTAPAMKSTFAKKYREALEEGAASTIADRVTDAETIQTVY